MHIVELIAPLEPSVAEELIGFWEGIFGISFAEQRGILAGDELDYNRDYIYIVREAGRLIGTCHLTVAAVLSGIGGVGEVAVSPQFRRRGIAEAMCMRARDTFRNCGGNGLFLATDMENAARVYHRVGWRKVNGSNAMLLTNDGKSPEEFLANHLDGKNAITVAAAEPGDRTAIIPLLMSPHDSYVLDANVGIFSPKHALQSSCMGLYPQYQKLRENGGGEWFAARTDDGRVVGLSSVRLDADGTARLDGFAHHCHADGLNALIAQAAEWAAKREAAVLESVVAVADQRKLSHFAAMGFQNVGEAAPLDLNGQNIPALRLEKTIVDRHAWRADFPHRLSDRPREQAASGVDAERI